MFAPSALDELRAVYLRAKARQAEAAPSSVEWTAASKDAFKALEQARALTGRRRPFDPEPTNHGLDFRDVPKGRTWEG